MKIFKYIYVASQFPILTMGSVTGGNSELHGNIY